MDERGQLVKNRKVRNTPFAVVLVRFSIHETRMRSVFETGVTSAGGYSAPHRRRETIVVNQGAVRGEGVDGSYGSSHRMMQHHRRLTSCMARLKLAHCGC